MSTNSSTIHDNPEMQALGLTFDKWQDAVEAAIATNQLTVTGEVRGGQLIQFHDASGAQLNILAVEPFATFLGFEGVTKAFAHVDMINDVLSYMDIVDPFGNSQAHITANLAQGPLLADEDTQMWQEVSISVAGLAVHHYASADAYESELGVFPCAFESAGAEIVDTNSASTPTAGARFAARVMECEWRHNQLTGQKFMHAVMDGVFPFDLCLDERFNDGQLPQKDSVLAGSALVMASVNLPTGGCGGGGCGSGGCGCGGH